LWSLTLVAPPQLTWVHGNTCLDNYACTQCLTYTACTIEAETLQVDTMPGMLLKAVL